MHKNSTQKWVENSGINTTSSTCASPLHTVLGPHTVTSVDDCPRFASTFNRIMAHLIWKEPSNVLESSTTSTHNKRGLVLSKTGRVYILTPL